MDGLTCCKDDAPWIPRQKVHVLYIGQGLGPFLANRGGWHHPTTVLRRGGRRRPTQSVCERELHLLLLIIFQAKVVVLIPKVHGVRAAGSAGNSEDVSSWSIGGGD